MAFARAVHVAAAVDEPVTPPLSPRAVGAHDRSFVAANGAVHGLNELGVRGQAVVHVPTLAAVFDSVVDGRRGSTWRQQHGRVSRIARARRHAGHQDKANTPKVRTQGVL